MHYRRGSAGVGLQKVKQPMRSLVELSRSCVCVEAFSSLRAKLCAFGPHELTQRVNRSSESALTLTLPVNHYHVLPLSRLRPQLIILFKLHILLSSYCTPILLSSPTSYILPDKPGSTVQTSVGLTVAELQPLANDGGVDTGQYPC